MQDGSRNRRREAWNDGHREPGLADRPVRERRLDGEGDLRANLRVMCPVRSYMNSSSRAGTGTGTGTGVKAADRIAKRNGRFESQGMVTLLPFF
jgi:hypothetical protein